MNNEEQHTVSMDIVRDRMMSFAEENGVKVLLAVESGSRGWGFPGKDSDWDCRFMFVRPVDHYLSVYQRPEQLNYRDSEFGGDLDIVGWDLRKVLRSAAKGNVVVSEWAQSPVVYHEEEGFSDMLIESAVQPWYSQLEALTAYLGMAFNAVGTSRKFITDEGKGCPGLVYDVSSKKLLYYVRTILAAYWASSGRPMPDMAIGGLLKHLESERPWHLPHSCHIKGLVKEKAELGEKDKFRTEVSESTLQLLYSMELEALSAKESLQNAATNRWQSGVCSDREADVDSVFRDMLDRYAT